MCIGCPYWKKCCKKVIYKYCSIVCCCTNSLLLVCQVWSVCVGCPKWKSCCAKATNPICSAANLACKALRKTAYAALWAAEKVVENSRWPLNLAKNALEVAKKIVDKNRWPLTAAKNILEGVKETMKVGASAATAIARFALGGLINIRKITFDVKIDVVKSGHFRGSIEVSFLKQPFKRLSFDLRLNSLVEMAKDLADSVFLTITGRSRRSVEDQLGRAIPDFSRKHYFPQENIYRPGNTKRDVSTHVKSAAELLSELNKKSAEDDQREHSNIENEEEQVISEYIEEDEGSDPLDELDEDIPFADDAKEAEAEAEELEHVGDSEAYLPSDEEELYLAEDNMEIKEIEKRSGKLRSFVIVMVNN